jgi:hypothetical protein
LLFAMDNEQPGDLRQYSELNGELDASWRTDPYWKSRIRMATWNPRPFFIQSSRSWRFLEPVRYIVINFLFGLGIGVPSQDPAYSAKEISTSSLTRPLCVDHQLCTNQMFNLSTQTLNQ